MDRGFGEEREESNKNRISWKADKVQMTSQMQECWILYQQWWGHWLKNNISQEAQALVTSCYRQRQR